MWDELRRKVGDAQCNLPPGAGPSIVNDDYGDVWGVFIALYGDEYSYAELKEYAKLLRRELLLVDDVASIDIFGDRPEVIYVELNSDRMAKLGIPEPESGMASTLEEAMVVAERIGYPLMVRPSFVLGGRGMEVVHDEEMLREYVAAAVGVTPDRPILIDKFLDNATEAEAVEETMKILDLYADFAQGVAVSGALPL